MFPDMLRLFYPLSVDNECLKCRQSIQFIDSFLCNWNALQFELLETRICSEAFHASGGDPSASDCQFFKAGQSTQLLEARVRYIGAVEVHGFQRNQRCRLFQIGVYALGLVEPKDCGLSALDVLELTQEESAIALFARIVLRPVPRRDRQQNCRGSKEQNGQQGR
jgi:hypothetical protein